MNPLPPGAPLPPLPPLLNLHDLRALTQLGRTAAYQLTRSPGFPRPVVLSARCLRWPAGEVLAYLESLRGPLVARVDEDA